MRFNHDQSKGKLTWSYCGQNVTFPLQHLTNITDHDNSTTTTTAICGFRVLWTESCSQSLLPGLNYCRSLPQFQTESWDLHYHRLNKQPIPNWQHLQQALHEHDEGEKQQLKVKQGISFLGPTMRWNCVYNILPPPLAVESWLIRSSQEASVADILVYKHLYVFARPDYNAPTVFLKPNTASSVSKLEVLGTWKFQSCGHQT